MATDRPGSGETLHHPANQTASKALEFAFIELLLFDAVYLPISEST
jgi:hypothetical protein